jgi:hypothetical protein
LAAASIETNRRQNAKVSLCSGAIQQKDIDFSRGQRDQALATRMNTTNSPLVVILITGLHAAREEVS